MRPVRVLILGAAGKDFHFFNTQYREVSEAKVVGFTAQQIPGIDDRRYPAELAGEGYPEGIPIFPEDKLEDLLLDLEVDVAVMAYSDLSHESVMHLASRVNALGVDFELPGAGGTMLESTVPVVAVCASRTGVGKSQTTRAVAKHLTARGHRVAVVRHPMPYGDLAAQAVQRFETYDDLEKHKVTIEEREEYEPHLAAGTLLFAGVDYEAILREAEKDADIVLWDGGNNDTSFFMPDLYLTLVDPHRPGHEQRFYPGETNVRMADVIIINKVATAYPEDVQEVRENVARLNPEAVVLEAASPLFVDDASVLKGKRVLVIEDGPTLTHGGMTYGAGTLGAMKAGAGEIVDPREFAVGEIAETYAKYPEIGALLPAMGYGDQQVKDLEETLRLAKEGGIEAVAIGTPIDLGRLIDIPLPHTRIRYEFQSLGEPTLAQILDEWLEEEEEQ